MFKSMIAVGLALALHTSVLAQQVFPFALPSDAGFPVDDFGVGKQWYLIQPTSTFPGRLNVQTVNADGTAGQGVWITFVKTGSGVNVGILDHTFEPLHKDLGTTDINDDSLITTIGNDLFGQLIESAFPTSYDNQTDQHGSEIAGIIAGVVDNSDGTIVGIAPNARIAYQETNTRNFTATSTQILSDLQAAISTWMDPTHKTTIANHSWNDVTWNGTPGSDQDFVINLQSPNASSFVTELTNSSTDILHIFAGGNTSDPIARTNAIAGVKKVMAISNITQAGDRDKTTSFGRQISVAAPGNDILMAAYSPINPGGTTTLSGTSFAAPMVAGVAALVKEAAPNLEPQQIRRIIEHTARAKSSIPSITVIGDDEPISQRSITHGYGIVDAYAAVDFAENHAQNGVTFPDPPTNLDSSRDTPGDIILTWDNATAPDVNSANGEYFLTSIYRYTGNLWSMRNVPVAKLELGDPLNSNIEGGWSGSTQDDGIFLSSIFANTLTDSQTRNDTTYTYVLYTIGIDPTPGAAQLFRPSQPSILVVPASNQETLIPLSTAAVGNGTQEELVSTFVGDVSLPIGVTLHEGAGGPSDLNAHFINTENFQLGDGVQIPFFDIVGSESDVVIDQITNEPGAVDTLYYYEEEYDLTDTNIIAASLTYHEIVEMWGQLAGEDRHQYGRLEIIETDGSGQEQPPDVIFDNHEYMTYNWRQHGIDLLPYQSSIIKIRWIVDINSSDFAITGLPPIFKPQADSRIFQGFGWAIDEIAVTVTKSSAQGCPALGDINSDGVIDNIDIQMLIANYGPCSGCVYDLNGDNTVNGTDLGIALSNFGTCP